MPRRLHERPLLLCAYAGALGRAGNAEQAAELLAASLRQHWHPALLSAYGLLAGADPMRQLRVAEGHLRAHPADPDLLLALGRIALRAQLWGKARDYLDSSLAAEPRSETCIELARLCEQLGDSARAHALLQRAFTPGSGRSATTMPALPRAPGSHR
jgi:HemY protein